MDLCSLDDAAVRAAAFWYLCDNLPSKYPNYKSSNFGHVAFIPAENNVNNHLGKLGDVTRIYFFVLLALLKIPSRYSRAHNGKRLVFLSSRINTEKLSAG